MSSIAVTNAEPAQAFPEEMPIPANSDEMTIPANSDEMTRAAVDADGAYTISEDGTTATKDGIVVKIVGGRRRRGGTKKKRRGGTKKKRRGGTKKKSGKKRR